jgi:hypothetical protein
MKELDLLKKDWKKQQANFPKLSYEDIYGLIHKKSSSVVKWIFIICIVEFIFWAGLNLLIPDTYLDIYEKFHLKTFLYLSQGLHYAVLIIFIVVFYKNYKSICVIDSTNLLMQKIIKTRKTVNYYVYYNIALYAILSIILNVSMFSSPNVLIETMTSESKNINNETFLNVALLVQIVTFFIVCGLLWLYYQAIYGFLLKKLNKNYKELEELN